MKLLSIVGGSGHGNVVAYRAGIERREFKQGCEAFLKQAMHQQSANGAIALVVCA